MPPTLGVEYLKVEDLKSDPRNARMHPKAAVETIKASLRRFGQTKPLVVRKRDLLVEAGNATLEAARQLGWKTIACVVFDDDDKASIGYGIADNRTGELSLWNFDTLATLLAELKAEDFPVAEIGWTEADLSTIAAGDWQPHPEDGSLGGETPPGPHGIALNEDQRKTFEAAAAEIRSQAGEKLRDGDVARRLAAAYLEAQG